MKEKLRTAEVIPSSLAADKTQRVSDFTSCLAIANGQKLEDLVNHEQREVLLWVCIIEVITIVNYNTSAVLRIN